MPQKSIRFFLGGEGAGCAVSHGGSNWVVLFSISTRMAVRGSDKDGKKTWWYAVLGSLVLISYGFIPCFQPTSNFGRIYAVYGGFFIVMSYFFGWVLDGVRPDVGDLTGGAIAILGVCLAYFWPRS
mmetsp:Transcript_18478/g.51558  ORF Transcript_18478/g.51558 Transcript_18478/m.51558 type:complete len:126 (+) Transcript_18478:460-837(+)